jgi:hypothetical protein
MDDYDYQTDTMDDYDDQQDAMSNHRAHVKAQLRMVVHSM